jgi:hypothetical protein
MTTADGRTDQSTDLADHVGGVSHGVGPIDRVRGVPTAEPDAAAAEIRALLKAVLQVDGATRNAARRTRSASPHEEGKPR